MSKKDLLTLVTQALNQALNPVKDSIESLHQEVEGLRRELKEKDVQIRELNDKLDEREQYSRRNNLRIFGVKESPRENTDMEVIKIAEQCGVSIVGSQIDRSHRVGKVGPNPRPIIVKFIGYGPRSKIFSAKKCLKGTSVTVREDLTSHRLALLKRAVQAYTLQKVWTHDGVILINTGNQRPSRVKCSADLDYLLEHHPPPS
ncbi:Protein unc-13-like protein C [Frankliniella fusca]|uniref:Protein unc-13-like protein C n=1 Tax=Frankliniella fusca TaxID=407009 RepID=A0AAE1HWQ7_9NEOP|nr:Protein unc-13-like protein C [Frankliniella fusca]